MGQSLPDALAKLIEGEARELAFVAAVETLRDYGPVEAVYVASKSDGSVLTDRVLAVGPAGILQVTLTVQDGSNEIIVNVYQVPIDQIVGIEQVWTGRHLSSTPRLHRAVVRFVNAADTIELPLAGFETVGGSAEAMTVGFLGAIGVARNVDRTDRI